VVHKRCASGVVAYSLADDRTTRESEAVLAPLARWAAFSGAKPRVTSLRFCGTFAVLRDALLRNSLISGGRYWDRTSGPCRVKAVLYR
jgi:hypothetical protein